MRGAVQRLMHFVRFIARGGGDFVGVLANGLTSFMGILAKTLVIFLLFLGWLAGRLVRVVRIGECGGCEAGGCGRKRKREERSTNVHGWNSFSDGGAPWPGWPGVHATLRYRRVLAAEPDDDDKFTCRYSSCRT